MSINYRHPSTQEKLRWLTANPNLPAGKPQYVSQRFEFLAKVLTDTLNDGPQLTIALQHLIDAKDAAVRQAIADSESA